MKKIFILYLIGLSCNLFAQKEDFNWVSGYSSIPLASNDSSAFGLITVNFLSNIPIQKKIGGQPLRLYDNNTCISDKNGKLLMYYNGNDVNNSLHQKMKGSDSLNHTKPINFLQAHQEFVPQGGLILPYPDHENQYMLIHQQVEFLVIQDSVADIRGERLYYSIIDMNKENGLGEVIERKKILLETALDYGKITACRHANGLDWWIIVSDYVMTHYNVFLLSENGITFNSKQEFSKGDLSSVGQAVFSPDGSKYIHYNSVSVNKGAFLDIFDFDRCKGVLSNQRYFSIKKDTAYSVGAAISPNSKYLYISSFKKVYQFDLQANDIFKSIDTVGIYDNVKDASSNVSTRFYLAQLAPDGKIYVSVPGTSKYLHVVNEPDKKGKACNFVQRGFTLAGFNYTTMPNFPNFRLGAAATPCNNVASEEVEKEKINIKIYPNPSTDFIYMEYDKEKLLNSKLIISDLQGKVVLQKELNEDKINISEFPKGIYFLQVQKEKKVLFREKIVIIN